MLTMANLQKIFKSLDAFQDYFKTFTSTPFPIQLLESEGKKYLAFASDKTTGSFLVLTVSKTSSQCRVSLEKLKSPKSIVKYATPKKLAMLFPTTGWRKSEKTENSYFIQNQALRDLVYTVYMKNGNAVSKTNTSTGGIESSPVMGYTLEKAIQTAVEKKNIRGLTLWPANGGGWQGNAQNNQKGWSVYFNKDPIKALLGALAGNIRT